MASVCLVWVTLADRSLAATTISPTNSYAFGANIGWLNTGGDRTNGASIGQFYCTDFIWSGNCGWISLGQVPLNRWHYSNTSASDWGVNVDRNGELRGLAYGANIGWIAFETNGNPRVDLFSGNLSGFAWGANIGWIALSNVTGYTCTTTLNPGPDKDVDGLPDAWELAVSGSMTNLNGGAADADGDGQPDLAEYLADTDPLSDSSLLSITDFTRQSGTNRVVWTVEPTRLYLLEQTDLLTNNAPWIDSGLGMLPPRDGLSLTGLVIDAATTTRFYRAKAIAPLAP